MKVKTIYDPITGYPCGTIPEDMSADEVLEDQRAHEHVRQQAEAYALMKSQEAERELALAATHRAARAVYMRSLDQQRVVGEQLAAKFEYMRRAVVEAVALAPKAPRTIEERHVEHAACDHRSGPRVTRFRGSRYASPVTQPRRFRNSRYAAQ